MLTINLVKKILPNTIMSYVKLKSFILKNKKIKHLFFFFLMSEVKVLL